MRPIPLTGLAWLVALLSAPVLAGELVVVGETEAGTLRLDPQSQHDHQGFGYENVAGRIDLRSPIMEAGRAVEAVEIALDFDCALGRYRVLAQTYLSRGDEYVRTDLLRPRWSATPRHGALARAERMVCPALDQTLDAALADYQPRRRSEAQVVELPRRPGAF
jgi:hypothetical protein